MTTALKKEFKSRFDVKRHFKLTPVDQLRPVLATLVNEPEKSVKVIIVEFVNVYELLVVPVDGSITELFTININAPGKDWALALPGDKGFLPCNEMEATEDPDILKRAETAKGFHWLQEDAKQSRILAVSNARNDVGESLAKVIEVALPEGHGSYYNHANLTYDTITAADVDGMIAELQRTKKLIEWRDNRVRDQKEDEK